MGHHQVRALLMSQPPVDLAPGAFRVLLVMATATHDSDYPPEYWAGISFLVINTPPRKPGSSRRAVMRHLSALQDAGYVIPTDRHKGHRRIYQLRIPGFATPPGHAPQPVDNLPWVGGKG